MPEEYRGQCDDIARQLVYSDIGQKVNLVFGGGKQNFVKKSDGGMYFRTDMHYLERQCNWAWYSGLQQLFNEPRNNQPKENSELWLVEIVVGGQNIHYNGFLVDFLK